MSNDDLFDDPSYFNRKYDADKAAERERAKAREALDAPEEKPTIDRQKMLQRIIDDTSEPYSVRMDARRLQEIFYMRPKDFLAEYNAFLQWRKEMKQ